MTTLSLEKDLLKKMTGRDHRHEKVHSKQRGECPTSQFREQLPDVLLIYLYPKFWVRCCEIGRKGVLAKVFLLENKYLYWFYIDQGLIVQQQSAQYLPLRSRVEERVYSASIHILDFWLQTPDVPQFYTYWNRLQDLRLKCISEMMTTYGSLIIEVHRALQLLFFIPLFVA